MALPIDKNHNPIQFMSLRQGLTHTMPFGAASTVSTAFDPNTLGLAIFATADCFVEVDGSNVVATVNSHFIPANTRVIFGLGGKNDVRPTNLAVIQSVGPGTLYISELY